MSTERGDGDGATEDAATPDAGRPTHTTRTAQKALATALVEIAFVSWPGTLRFLASSHGGSIKFKALTTAAALGPRRALCPKPSKMN